MEAPSLKVSALFSESSAPGLIPDLGHCVLGEDT